MQRGSVSVPRVAAVALAAALAAMGGCHEAAPVREVRVAYDHPLVTFDPHGHDDAITRSVLFAVYEPLACLDPHLEVRACLAERWTTPSPTTWRFTVRKGVLFHDGRPLRPADVLASLRRASRSAGAAAGAYLSAVESISLSREDPSTIEIRTVKPTPLLLSRLAMIPIVPADFRPDHPVGTGPYRLMPGSTRADLTLTRWDRYWGRSGAFDRIRIVATSSEKRLRQLILAGDVDAVTDVSASFIHSVLPYRDWRVERTPALATTILGLNVLHWPLSDPRVREAIDLAIDRRRLAEEAFPDHDVSPASSLIPVEVFGYSEAGMGPPPDPGRARRLLKGAGVPEGTTIVIDVSGMPPAALAFLSASLLRVGLKVQFDAYPWSVLYRRMERDQSEAHIFGWNYPLADASDFFESCVHTREPDKHLGGQNSASYSNVQVDRWIEESSRLASTSQRLDLIRRILTRLRRDRPYLALYHRKNMVLIRKPFVIPPRAGSWVLPQEISLAGTAP